MIGNALHQRMTVDGLRDMIGDLRLAGDVPTAILLNEYDRREMNQRLMAEAINTVARADGNADLQSIGVIEGIMIASHPDVPRGKARLVYGHAH